MANISPSWLSAARSSPATPRPPTPPVGMQIVGETRPECYLPVQKRPCSGSPSLLALPRRDSRREGRREAAGLPRRRRGGGGDGIPAGGGGGARRRQAGDPPHRTAIGRRAAGTRRGWRSLALDRRR